MKGHLLLGTGFRGVVVSMVVMTSTVVVMVIIIIIMMMTTEMVLVRMVLTVLVADGADGSNDDQFVALSWPDCQQASGIVRSMQRAFNNPTS